MAEPPRRSPAPWRADKQVMNPDSPAMIRARERCVYYTRTFFAPTPAEG
jgi:hypothetical protein